jgi:hypothetical protein
LAAVFLAQTENKNIIYPHMTEICGYSLVTVFLMKVR